MGGRRILYALILIALVGLIQADIPTYLTQTVSPTSGAYGPVTPTFTCGYSASLNGTVVPVTSATVVLFVGSYANLTMTETSPGTYQHTGPTLNPNTYSWYCIAFRYGYQTQTGAPQTYVVKSGGGGGGGGRHYLIEPTPELPQSGSWQVGVVILTIIGLGIGYFILRDLLATTSTPKRKRK